MFHKLLAERRSVTGFTACPHPKPVTDRRSTLLPIQAACEICGLRSIFPGLLDDRVNEFVQIFPGAKRLCKILVRADPLRRDVVSRRH